MGRNGLDVPGITTSVRSHDDRGGGPRTVTGARGRRAAPWEPLLSGAEARARGGGGAAGAGPVDRAVCCRTGRAASTPGAVGVCTLPRQGKCCMRGVALLAGVPQMSVGDLGGGRH